MTCEPPLPSRDVPPSYFGRANKPQLPRSTATEPLQPFLVNIFFNQGQNLESHMQGISFGLINTSQAL